jgi:hypothetical protein
LQLYFLPAPQPISFFSFFFAFETFPTQPPTVPYRPTHLYIWIKSRVFPIYLLTYKFKMWYSHPHPPTCLTTDLPINILSRYLPNPTYMATPTYTVPTAIDPQWSTTMRKE